MLRRNELQRGPHVSERSLRDGDDASRVRRRRAVVLLGHELQRGALVHGRDVHALVGWRDLGLQSLGVQRRAVLDVRDGQRSLPLLVGRRAARSVRERLLLALDGARRPVRRGHFGMGLQPLCVGRSAVLDLQRGLALPLRERVAAHRALPERLRLASRGHQRRVQLRELLELPANSLRIA